MNFHNFSKLQIVELTSHFNIQDLLRDGLLSYTELKRALKRFGLVVADRTLSDSVNKFDPNCLGLYNFQIFLDVANDLRSLHLTEYEVMEAFKIFDRDGTGQVDAIEFMRIMISIGDKIDKNEAELMIKHLAGKDGKVHYKNIAKSAMSSL